MNRVGVTLTGLLLLAVAGPAESSPSNLPASTVVIDSDHGPVRFSVEIAADDASQHLGLMYRKKMAPDAGMLFDFHQPVYTSFWMKNTILPLDMIFIRQNGTISSVAADAVPYSETPIPSTEPIRAVLEINAGRAAALGIAPDERVHSVIFGTALPGQK